MSCPPSERKSVPGTHRSSPVLGPIRGAYQPRSHPARLQGLRHTGRHHPRHAPYPPRGQRRSHTASVDEEDIGTSDSSSTTSDYSSGGSKDELEEDDEEESEDVASQGFGFSAATWSSTRSREGARVMYEDKKDVHYVMEERHSSRYYPGPHHPRTNHYARRPSLSPERYRRPVSPEPLYREYREYRDSRHHRDRLSRTSRSSQTSPVRVEPIHSSVPRTFVRALTPSRYRRPRDDPDKHRPKYQYESRVPPPPPSLSAPLTLRPPPPARSSAALSSNAHTAPLYHSAPSPPSRAPPRLVLPGPAAIPREDNDHDLGEDEVDDDDDDDDAKDEFKPLPPKHPRTLAPAYVPRKRTALLSTPGGSSTSTFALSGGPSAPANNNGTTSTTTTFHVTTPRAISASLAAAQNAAAAQTGTAALQVESEKAEAEKMRIPSFKRGGKTRYECLYCSKDFSRKNDAYRHMSRKHNDNATEFICVCGRVLSRGDALTRHMRTCRESKDKGQVAVAISGSAFVQGAPVKVSASMPKKRGTKKRKGGDIVSPPGPIHMDVDGEEELIDDVSMEEED